MWVFSRIQLSYLHYKYALQESENKWERRRRGRKGGEVIHLKQKRHVLDIGWSLLLKKHIFLASRKGSGACHIQSFQSALHNYLITSSPFSFSNHPLVMIVYVYWVTCVNLLHPAALAITFCSLPQIICGCQELENLEYLLNVTFS